jgi:hypothetical protein
MEELTNLNSNSTNLAGSLDLIDFGDTSGFQTDRELVEADIWTFHFWYAIRRGLFSIRNRDIRCFA